MKPNSVYLRVCQLAFVLACCVGVSFALSYLRFVHANTWLAWAPGLGIALIFAAMVMCFVGHSLSIQSPANRPRYFQFCLSAFVAACCFGVNLAMTYLHLAQRNDWAAWRPGIGIGMIFTSMLLSYIGFALSARRTSHLLCPSV